MSINVEALRAVQLRYLTDAATILRYSETSSSEGIVADWQPVATGVPCRVSHPGRSASEAAGEGAALRATSEWAVWLPALTDVTVRDRLTITGTDRPDGRTFEVESVAEKTNETARRCDCVLVT